jgi:hypothetical protein
MRALQGPRVEAANAAEALELGDEPLIASAAAPGNAGYLLPRGAALCLQPPPPRGTSKLQYLPAYTTLMARPSLLAVPGDSTLAFSVASAVAGETVAFVDR